MPRPVCALAPAALLAVVLAACSSSGGSGAAGTPSPSSVPPATTSAPSSVVASSAAASTVSSGPASSAAAPSTTAPSATGSSKAASGGGITFTGKISGRMTVTACAGGIAQLEVDVDGEDTTYTGVIDAKDFGITGPDSTAYFLAHGTSLPQVGAGGTTFTVKGTKLVGLTHDDTLTATGSVTCP